jgi:hypothetical protein
MKKLFKIFACAALALSVGLGGVTVAYGAQDIRLYLDGEQLETDVPPMIINDRTMVPVRVISEAVGCKVEWRAEDQSVIVYSPAGGDPLLVMQIDNPDVTVNSINGYSGEYGGEVEIIDSPPVIRDGRTLVPLRFIAETIGLDVEWEPNDRIVYLYSAVYDGDYAMSDPGDTGSDTDNDEQQTEDSVGSDPGDTGLYANTSGTYYMNGDEDMAYMIFDGNGGFTVYSENGDVNAEGYMDYISDGDYALYDNDGAYYDELIFSSDDMKFTSFGTCLEYFWAS